MKKKQKLETVSCIDQETVMKDSSNKKSRTQHSRIAVVRYFMFTRLLVCQLVPVLNLSFFLHFGSGTNGRQIFTFPAPFFKFVQLAVRYKLDFLVAEEVCSTSQERREISNELVDAAPTDRQKNHAHPTFVLQHKSVKAKIRKIYLELWLYKEEDLNT